MSIHLYLAPSGAGKTAYAVERARDAARGLRGNTRVCVPTSLQVQAWRKRLAHAGGALGARVSTFDALYEECLAATGDAYTLLDEPVQYRLLRAVVDALPLAHFSPLRGRPGFIQVLQELIAELKAARIRPEDFRRAVDRLGSPPRLTDLADLYAAYQERLQANAGVDRAGLAWLAVAAVPGRAHGGGDGSLLVVDGFDNFTQVQIDLLRALAPKTSELLITLTGDVSPRTPAHRRFNRTRARLEAALGVRAEPLPQSAAVAARTCPPDPTMAGTPHPVPALAHLEAHLFAHGGVDAPWAEPMSAPAVELIEAADRAAEVRAALRWLKARIVRDGVRPDETALLARSIPAYRPFVLQTAAEFGLPIHLVGGLPLMSNPAVAALLALLGLTVETPGLPWRRVVEAWRSPYFDWAAAYPLPGAAEPVGITAADAGALDVLARQARVVGGVMQWEEALQLAADRAAGIEDAGDENGDARDLHDDANLRTKFHRFLERITPPAGQHSYREFVAWVEALIGADPAAQSTRFPRDDDETSLRVVERAREAAPEVAEWDVAALIQLKDVLRGLVTAEQALDPATDAGLDFARFYAELVDVVQSTSYEPRRDARPGAILVADVAQARGLPLRAVAVLGLGEGEFPAPQHEDPFLRDADRRAMRGVLGLPLDLSTESAESEYFYETVTRPNERLLLVRSRLADNGAMWQASPFWEEVRRWVDVRPLTLIGDAAPAPAQAASWPELMESFAAHDAPSG
jgi:superfamily I DNA/RNA helicase